MPNATLTCSVWVATNSLSSPSSSSHFLSVHWTVALRDAIMQTDAVVAFSWWCSEQAVFDELCFRRGLLSAPSIYAYHATPFISTKLPTHCTIDKRWHATFMNMRCVQHRQCTLAATKYNVTIQVVLLFWRHRWRCSLAVLNWFDRDIHIVVKVSMLTQFCRQLVMTQFNAYFNAIGCC